MENQIHQTHKTNAPTNISSPWTKKGGSLSKIEIPIEHNGEIVGWKTICETKEVHEAIVARNIEHFDQASPTPFGSSEGYNYLHGPNRWTHMKEITEGKSGF